MRDDGVLITTDIDTGAVLAVEVFGFLRRFQTLDDFVELPVAPNPRSSATRHGASNESRARR